MKTNRHFWSYLAQFFLEWKMFQTNVVEKIETHIRNRAVYGIMWKHIIERDRPQVTIRRMRMACWITKATNTHSEFVILNDFYCNNGYTNAPQCYVIRALFVFLSSVVIILMVYILLTLFIHFTFHWSYTDVELVMYTFSIISKASVHKLCLIVAS